MRFVEISQHYVANTSNDKKSTIVQTADGIFIQDNLRKRIIVSFPPDYPFEYLDGLKALNHERKECT